jgi:TPR repeat protein
MAIIVVIGLLCGVGAGYYFLYHQPPEVTPPQVDSEEKPLPRMANLPPPAADRAVLHEPDYPPDAPALEQARRALRDGITPEAAVALAAGLPECPERADAAFLLLEHAAESGHADAAFAVARYYDPTDSLPSGTLRKSEANAYEWYRVALDSGRRDAAERLRTLRTLVRKRADQGDWEAKQLLKSWDSSSGG